MKIWEAIVYGIVGGIAELLPISFSGHVVLLRNVFHMSSLSEGGGFFIRAAICLGVIFAIYLSFPFEARKCGRELSFMIGIKKRNRNERVDRLMRRSIMLCAVALSFMLCSLFFLASAERIERLLYIIIFFLIYSAALFFCCRGRVGQKDEKSVTIVDLALIGVARMISVFPGLSAIGSSIAVGRACGISVQYNIRIAYLLTLAYQVALFFFYFIRGFVYGVFSFSVVLPFLLAMLFATVFGYLAIQYFRYLLQRVKFNAFIYYTLEITAVATVVALINA